MMFDNLPQDVKCNDLQLVINRENGMFLQEVQQEDDMERYDPERILSRRKFSRECHHHWQFCKERRMRLL